MKYLITIIGPTAIGKTALSIALAQHFHCEIVSCDSRQFFKEMTIGTAVPNTTELATIEHHFIQNKSIFDNYSVGNFEKEVIATIENLHKKNDYAIMVGGSGLYVDAVLNGLDCFPDIDVEVRNQINLDYEIIGIEYLQKQLQLLDPNYYNHLLKNNSQTLQNPQRMKRFIEVCIGTGKAYSTFLNNNENSRNFTPIIIGIEADRKIIYDRINQRVDLMIGVGLLEEAMQLFEFKHLNALQTVGYRELFDFFENKCTLNQAIENIKMNTRRFSKRQMTWFKRTENTTWVDYKTDFRIVANIISQQTNQ